MKLIKTGIIPDDVLFTGKCIYCYSIMEATRSELTTKPDRNGVYYAAECLLCGKNVSFIEKR